MPPSEEPTGQGADGHSDNCHRRTGDAPGCHGAVLSTPDFSSPGRLPGGTALREAVRLVGAARVGARGCEMGQEAAEAVGKTSSDIARQSGQASKHFLRGVASPWHPLQFCSELSASAPAAS